MIRIVSFMAAAVLITGCSKCSQTPTETPPQPHADGPPENPPAEATPEAPMPVEPKQEEGAGDQK